MKHSTQLVYVDPEHTEKQRLHTHTRMQTNVLKDSSGLFNLDLILLVLASVPII